MTIGTTTNMTATVLKAIALTIPTTISRSLTAPQQNFEAGIDEKFCDDAGGDRRREPPVFMIRRRYIGTADGMVHCAVIDMPLLEMTASARACQRGVVPTQRTSVHMRARKYTDFIDWPQQKFEAAIDDASAALKIDGSYVKALMRRSQVYM